MYLSYLISTALARNHKKHRFIVLLLMSSLWSSATWAQPRQMIIDDSELTIQVIETNLSHDSALKTLVTDKKALARVLWLPSEYGVLEQEKQLARQLATYGIESWFVDFYETLFLAPSPSSVDQIPAEWVAKLLALAKQDGLPLWIIAPNKAGQTAIKGLHTYLQTANNGIGLLLVNPNLYLNTPQAGMEAEYWPQVSHLNLPVTVIQSAQSPWRWRLEDLSSQLQKAGSDVFTLVEPGVRDRYYFRADAMQSEQTHAKGLANRLIQAMLLQQPYLATSRQSKRLESLGETQVEQTRSTELQPYLGQQNLTLQLTDQFDRPVDLKDYLGKVVLVNFWASWCPPCVFEMPSMSRLKTHFKEQPFEILAVNLGEDKSQIEAFVRTHPVNFPILVDRQGIAVKEWKVFAYPSSYLIDQNGQIRFALFGATEWDEASHLEKINKLLSEN